MGDKRIRSRLSDDHLSKFRKLESVEEIVLFAANELNMTLNELIAVPEQDNWHYSCYGGMPVFTPASFVTAALKAYGVFEGIEITAAEQTVTDVYQFQIYDAVGESHPEKCIEADYKLPYC